MVAFIPRDPVALILLITSVIISVLLIILTKDPLVLLTIPISIFSILYTRIVAVRFPMYAYTFYGMNLVFFGLYLYRDFQYKIRRDFGAVATVIDVIKEESSGFEGTGTDRFYNPILFFRTKTGEEVRTHYEESSQNSSRYRVGDVFDILYNPENPKDVWIDSPSRRLFNVAFRWGLIGFGGTLSLTSLLYMLGILS